MTAPGSSAKIRVLKEEADRVLADSRPLFARIAALRKKAAAQGLTDDLRELLKNAETEAELVQGELRRLEAEMIAASGISESTIEEIERAIAESVSDPVDRRARASVTGDEIEPGALLEDLAPAALERMLDLVGPTWLRAEEAKGYRLDRPSSTHLWSL